MFLRRIKHIRFTKLFVSLLLSISLLYSSTFDSHHAELCVSYKLVGSSSFVLVTYTKARPPKILRKMRVGKICLGVFYLLVGPGHSQRYLGPGRGNTDDRRAWVTTLRCLDEGRT